MAEATSNANIPARRDGSVTAGRRFGFRSWIHFCSNSDSPLLRWLRRFPEFLTMNSGHAYKLLARGAALVAPIFRNLTFRNESAPKWISVFSEISDPASGWNSLSIQDFLKVFISTHEKPCILKSPLLFRSWDTSDTGRGLGSLDHGPWSIDHGP